MRIFDVLPFRVVGARNFAQRRFGTLPPPPPGPWDSKVRRGAGKRHTPELLLKGLSSEVAFQKLCEPQDLYSIVLAPIACTLLLLVGGRGLPASL